MKAHLLMYASYNGHDQIVKLLLSHPQIDVGYKSKNGSDAITVCCDNYSGEDKEEKKRMIVSLLQDDSLRAKDLPRESEKPSAGSSLEKEKKETSNGKQSEDELYLQQALAAGKKEWGRGKIMIVGEGRAGKSALTNSILGRPYQELESTVGVERFTCSVGYASIGEEKRAGHWQEMEREGAAIVRAYESSVAAMIVQQRRVSRDPLVAVTVQTVEMDLVDAKLLQRPARGYLEPVLSPPAPVVALREEVMIAARETKENEKEAAAIIASRQISSSEPNKNAPSKSVKNEPITQTTVTITEQTKEAKEGNLMSKVGSLDTSLVMKLVGEQQRAESKFIMSVFDFGGQSVFNVIHPFFFTRCGLYLLTFNMEWLAAGASEETKASCLETLSFWLNSVIIHTQTDHNDSQSGVVAPIFFVGTRKDLIASPKEHEQIATLLYQTFRLSKAWRSVIEHERGEGSNGRTRFCFFPVNNKLGSRDVTLQALLQQIEKVTDSMDYVHVERPLTWFQVIDALRGLQRPFVSYAEVVQLCRDHDIPAERCPVLLRFLHEMGMVMWHEEESLRELVLLDPIESFVTPATRIICKHNPTADDPTYHFLDLHKEAMKAYPIDFDKMILHGLVTERLLQDVLRRHSGIADYVQHLMIKYGLLVALPPPSLEKSSVSVDLLDKEPLFLAPALLPIKENRSQSQSLLFHSYLTKHQTIANRFAFVFAASVEGFNGAAPTLEQCARHGFYPQGLFERLLVKAIAWSVKTSSFSSYRDFDGSYRGYAELVFGNQRFSMMVDSRHHCISVVMMEGNHPLAIHDRLKEQITEIINECWKSLKFFTVLLYGSIPTSNMVTSDSKEMEEAQKKEKSLQLLRLSALKQIVEKRSVLPLVKDPDHSGSSSTLSSSEAMRQYPAWFVDHHPQSEYDLFISYRWGVLDTSFVDSLFDRLSGSSVDVSQQRPIHTFLDRKRLPPGQDFQVQLVKSLSRSLVMVPIVSAEALHRMKELQEGEEDNTLMEWICGLALIRHRERLPPPLTSITTNTTTNTMRLVKILPIFFGPRDASAPQEKLSKIGRDLFAERCLEELSDRVVPRRCLELSQQLLTKLYGEQDWLEELSQWSIRSIVRSLSKYLFLCAWKYETLREVVMQATEEIVKEVNEQLLQEKEREKEETREVSLVMMTASPLTTTTNSTDNTCGSNASYNTSNTMNPVETSSKNDLKLAELIELIRKELGITETNKGKVLQLAVEDLMPADQQKVNRCSDMKEKAIQILQILGVEV